MEWREIRQNYRETTDNELHRGKCGYKSFC